MTDKIEKLMNSTCKEDILLAMHLVKHHTGIQSPVVIMWWIERRCKIPYYVSFWKDKIVFYKGDRWLAYAPVQFTINHSELE